MALQIILCLETNKKAATDYVYILDTIKHFYVLNNEIKISPIFMNGKMNYNSKSILKEIEKQKKEYIHGNSEVIYCIDVDDIESNAEHIRQFDEIKKYVEQNNCSIIWFCHDIEDVYLGKRIQSSKKVSEASNFRRKNMIQRVNPHNLADNTVRPHASNILNVLDRFLSRK